MPLFVLVLAVWVLLLIPFRVLGEGFLPSDDALRHSAKVVSGKDWPQILVLRSDIALDSHPGWHFILGNFYRLTGCDTLSLVLFSVTLLFILFSVPPLFFLKYPESWLFSIMAISIIAPSWLYRLLLGRPYIFTMMCLFIILFLWPRLKYGHPSIKVSAAIILSIAASTWIHCSWYLFSLPVIALLFVREWKAAFLLSIFSLAGIAIGSSLTGHPLIFLRQTTEHLFLAFGSADMQKMLVGEFQAGPIDVNIAFLVLGVFAWRIFRGKGMREITHDPVFVLVIFCACLGLITRRIWLDWGMPSLVYWAAVEFDDFFKTNLGRYSWNRILICGAAAGVLFLSVTSDINSRWSSFKPRDYISIEDPAQAKWLPGNGGIVYSDSMDVFYRMFFKNPNAPWRYMVGFEPALMPPDDLRTLRNIQRYNGNYKMYGPWVKKMRPEDRLILHGSADIEPKIPELRWKHIAIGVWSGRKER